MNPEEEEEDTPGQGVALVDLLLGMAGILFLTAIVLLPTVEFAARAAMDETTPAARLEKSQIRYRGAEVRPFVAGPWGLRSDEEGSAAVPPDRILADAGLAARLAALRDGAAPVLLLVEPDGEEAAFLFDALAARQGIARFGQVRLDGACDFAKGAAKSLCAGAP